LKQGFEVEFRNEFAVKYRINTSGFSVKNESLMLLEDLKVKIKYSTPLNKKHQRFIRSQAFKIALKHPESYKELLKVYRFSNDNILYYFTLIICCLAYFNFFINLIIRIRLRIIKELLKS